MVLMFVFGSDEFNLKFCYSNGLKKKNLRIAQLPRVSTKEHWRLISTSQASLPSFLEEKPTEEKEAVLAK